MNGHEREVFARIAGTEFVLIGSPRRHQKARNPPTGIHVTNTESASLVLDNGGAAVTNSITVAVQEPISDAWVERTPGANEKPVNTQFYARDDAGFRHHSL